MDQATAPSGAPPPPPAPTPLEAHAALPAKLSVPVCLGGLDAYDIIAQPAGKGGYAVVHRATRKSDGRRVAVKKVEVSLCIGRSGSGRAAGMDGVPHAWHLLACSCRSPAPMSEASCMRRTRSAAGGEPMGTARW